MNIRVSRRTLRRLKRLVMGTMTIVMTTFGCFWLGQSMTPRTAEGRPILYSPAVRAAETYRARVVEWVASFERLDSDLGQLLDSDADLYEQSVQADHAIDQATRLSQDIDLTSVPAALAELRQTVAQVSVRYLTAVQAIAASINAPTPDSRQAATQKLDQARQAFALLKQSRWLKATSDQGSSR